MTNMERSDTHITASNDAMFNAVKDKLLEISAPSLLVFVENIHTYIMESFAQCWDEAFISQASTSWGGHVTGL